MKRTKIVATAGPSSESEDMLHRLIDAGVNVFRLNLKHNTPEWHTAMISRIREASRKKNQYIGILLDLQGPEIRIGTFRNGSITLHEGEKVAFTDLGETGGENRIILNNRTILSSLAKGDRFFIDDGAFEFSVAATKKHTVTAKVLRGGVLRSNKSVNFPNLKVDVPVLLKRDHDYIKLGIKNGVDFFALSFVRNASDIKSLRKTLQKARSATNIIAKIERPQAVHNFDEILEASDGIMIGRGDLGIEIPLPKVPIVQKEIIRKCREAAKPVITATQMLESMIMSIRPTRAEVSDVANAIIDGTDAVMLSAESATGLHPVEAVSIMAEIDRTVEQQEIRAPRMAHRKSESQTEAISQAVDTLTHHALDFKAIALLTETGRTARMTSKFRPRQPIYACTQDETVARQLSLTWGVYPIVMSLTGRSNESLFEELLIKLRKQNHLKKGDKVICVSGSILGKENMTNSINIATTP